MLLSEIAHTLQARLIGDGQQTVTGINTIAAASGSEVCFLSSAKHKEALKQSRAAAVIIAAPLGDSLMAQLVVDDVNAALIQALGMFSPKLTPFEGIHPTAIIEPSAQIDPTAAIGPRVYISHHVKIGSNTQIGPGCSVGENSTIGSDSRLDSNVVVYHNCQIGDRCVIQANSTIGSVGYGYSFIKGRHRLVPHNGGVVIEDEVEIGANSCVDRAKFGNTLIGAGTKIDNLVQIAHNVQIGKCCLFAGQSGVGGSTKIGNGVIFAGHAGVIDNRTLGEGAVVCANSAATKDIPAGQAVMGMPPQELQRELRCVSVFQRLPELAKELKTLQKKVQQLEAAENDKK